MRRYFVTDESGLTFEIIETEDSLTVSLANQLFVNAEGKIAAMPFVKPDDGGELLNG